MCKYCEEYKYITAETIETMDKYETCHEIDFSQQIIGSWNGTTILQTDVEVEEINFIHELILNYCPMCGRKLVEE